MQNKLIFGKDITERIVSIEPDAHGKCRIFRELADGTIHTYEVPNTFWILFDKKMSPKMETLSGNQHYRHLLEYDSINQWMKVMDSVTRKRLDVWVPRYPRKVFKETRTGKKYYDGLSSGDTKPYHFKDAFQIKNGFTHYKGMSVKEVSVLSFDIETTGLRHKDDSRVLLISNTYRSATGEIVKKLFSFDEYYSDKDMFTDWCNWVRKMNPSILVGHNIYGFDLPYIKFCADKCGAKLKLGRDKSELEFDERINRYRKDGSQSYDYHNAHVYGREIVDTFFLAMKYDIGRNYENYKLKTIIAHEGLEKPGRQFYDAGTIRDNYKKPKEWEKIKAYAIDDADDSLALYDLMIQSFFYSVQSIPKSIQNVINTASGSWVGSIMIRSYLQDGHSIAKATEGKSYRGAISFGVPGIHSNVFKIDVRSLYPSIMLNWNIHDAKKDPKNHFIQLVRHFTEARIKLKALAQESGDSTLKAQDGTAKIFINSAYGFLGSKYANYNYPDGAEEVTRKGREILKQAVLWATGHEFDPIKYGLEEEEVEEYEAA